MCVQCARGGCALYCAILIARLRQAKGPGHADVSLRGDILNYIGLRFTPHTPLKGGFPALCFPRSFAENARVPEKHFAPRTCQACSKFPVTGRALLETGLGFAGSRGS